METVGTTRFDESFNQYSVSLEIHQRNKRTGLMNLQDLCPVLLSFETSVDTFQKTSQFLNVFFGDQFYPAIIFNYLHLLP